MTDEFCDPEIYSVGLLLSLVNQSIMSYLGKRDQVVIISPGLRINSGRSDFFFLILATLGVAENSLPLF